jgi:hypothetical protein
MPVLSHPAFGPRTALGYVTVGALMCVWTGVWYWTRESDLSRSSWFWVAGLFLTGATLIFLGLILGPLGRVARRAELPPPDALRAEAAIQQTAAANPPAVLLPATGQGGMAATGTGVANPAVPAAAMPTQQVAPGQVSPVH